MRQFFRLALAAFALIRPRVSAHPGSYAEQRLPVLEQRGIDLKNIVVSVFHEIGNVDYIIMFSHFDPFFLLNK